MFGYRGTFKWLPHVQALQPALKNPRIQQAYGTFPFASTVLPFTSSAHVVFCCPRGHSRVAYGEYFHPLHTR
eukprot:7095430-Karenia_brevis.AAC.1